jgi:hypothetical protein
MKNNQYLIVVIVALLVGAGSFFGGMKYQQSQQSSNRMFGNFQGARTGNGQVQGQGNRMMANRPVSGDIISADDKSITVKMPDGSSKIILFSDKTEINEASQAAKQDLTVGKKVAVFGQVNSDGSVTAQNIQLNPILKVQGQAPQK